MPTSPSTRAEKRSRSVPAAGPRRITAFLPIALLPPAAFAVHQLRFMLAYGAGAGAELARTGHSYLHSVVPWLVALIGLAAGWLLRGLGRALGGQRTPARYAVSLTGLWLACSAVLVAIYGTQEFLEGQFAPGHPAGLTGIFGYGGGWAVFAAVCIGLVLAAICHGAVWAIDAVARRYARTRPHAPRTRLVRVRWTDASLPRLAPLANGWSGRGPPR